MEIKEIVSYYLNPENDILDVTFRTIDDSDDVIRTDKIDFLISEEYGFDLITENFDLFSDEFDEELFDSEKIDVDEDELISFLNEYYMLNPNSLPKAETF
jgi:hypothetical protein